MEKLKLPGILLHQHTIQNQSFVWSGWRLSCVNGEHGGRLLVKLG